MIKSNVDIDKILQSPKNLAESLNMNIIEFDDLEIYKRDYPSMIRNIDKQYFIMLKENMNAKLTILYDDNWNDDKPQSKLLFAEFPDNIVEIYDNDNKMLNVNDIENMINMKIGGKNGTTIKTK